MTKRKSAKRRRAKKLPKRNKGASARVSVVTDTNTDQIALLFRKANLLSVAIRNTTAVQIGSIRLREKIKQFVKDYFRLLRPELSSGGILTNELDQLMQSSGRKRRK